MSLHPARQERLRTGTRRRERLLVGWREWVGFPELGVRRIKAKVDTGARTSSLHAFRLKRFQRDGRAMVRFEVQPVQRSSASRVVVEAPLAGERKVRNSGGDVELRPFIVTALEIGGRRWPIEITLTRRDEMGFRMLLGRRALRGRANIDPSASFLAGLDPGTMPGKSPRRTGRRGTEKEDE